MSSSRLDSRLDSTRLDASSHTSRARVPASVKVLTLILGVLAIGAIQGGLAMVMNPEEPLGMTTDFLDGTPVDSYFWPGMFLLGIAIASLLTIVGLLFGWRWAWAAPIEAATGHLWPWLGAVATGGVLLVFEVIELFMVPFHPVMHPLVIGLSMVIIGLAFLPSAQHHLRAGSLKVVK
jgi:hypothetical protein